MAKPVAHEWLTALHDARVAGADDIAAGVQRLIDHYLAEGWAEVRIVHPGWGNPSRDHGYRRVYAWRPTKASQDALRSRVLRHALANKSDAYGGDGCMHVGVAHGRECVSIVTMVRRTDGSIAVIDVREHARP